MNLDDYVKYSFLDSVGDYVAGLGINGIGKLDSFPSIMHRELKTMFQWKLEDKDLFKCLQTVKEI